MPALSLAVSRPPTQPRAQAGRDRLRRTPRAPEADLTLLETNSVSPKTLEDYSRRLTEFGRFLMYRVRRSWRHPVLSELVLEIFEECYLEGRPAAHGDKPLAVLRCLRPSCAALLPTCGVMPTAPRSPLPMAAVAAWAAALSAGGRTDMGVAVMLAADGFLRLGEALTLRVASLHAPVVEAHGTMASHSFLRRRAMEAEQGRGVQRLHRPRLPDQGVHRAALVGASRGQGRARAALPFHARRVEGRRQGGGSPSGPQPVAPSSVPVATHRAVERRGRRPPKLGPDQSPRPLGERQLGAPV